MTVVHLLSFLLLSPAHAFQPEGPQTIGIEPQRVWHTHPAVQAQLARQDAFQNFRRTTAPGWQARFDEVTGAPMRLWGAGIPMPTQSADELAQAIVRLVETHDALFQVEPGQLVVTNVQYSDHLDTWYVDLQAPRGGVPIERGGLTARVKHGNLIMLGALTYGATPTTGDWLLDGNRTIAEAVARGPAPDAAHTERSAEPMWLPVEDLAGLRLVATWKVRSKTAEPIGHWVSFIDAETGELLNVHNEVRFMDGAVTGFHHDRYPDGSPLVESPMPRAWVSNGVDEGLTADDGTYTVADGLDYTTDLNGSYVRVVNMDGDDGVMTNTNGVFTWTDADATQAEISTFVFLNQMKAWGTRVAPDVPMVTQKVTSRVNITSGNCNAYFDGNVNFYSAGGGCNNTADIADVNFHEWGHGFHLWSITSTWYGFDGSLSEGAADTVAFLQTGDNIIAPYFLTGGSGIRDVAPNRRYPEDFIASEYAVHSNGLIFGGTMWDLWNDLVDIYGYDDGTARTEAIFAAGLKGGPDIASSFDEFLVGDDDDGDLSNGTPHECELIDAFGAHGLGPLGSGSMYVADHTPITAWTTPEIGAEISLNLDSAAPNCFGITPVKAKAHFRVNGGNWSRQSLDITGNNASGSLPVQAFGAFIEYYLSVEDESGSTFTVPAGADINPFSFFNGDSLVVHCDTFDGTDDGGYTHKLLDGEDVEGADDWQWGQPNGNGGDPSSAYSGAKVWGNDLGWDNFNGQYQNEKKNRLRSPEIDTLHYQGSYLNFQRWLNIEDGVFDQAEVLADGQLLWSNLATNTDIGDRHHLDQMWAPVALDLLGTADDGSVQLTWTLESDQGLAFGGWTLDDVCVMAPNTPDNRLGINGLVAERNQGAVALSWTQPLHDPIEDVMVIRSVKGPPESVSDGVLLATLRNVEPGSTGYFTDPIAPGYDTWYAVFASDGTHVLSWARDGYNRVLVSGTGAAPSASATIAGEPVGCGCATGSTTSGLGGGFALLALLGLRRRRETR